MKCITPLIKWNDKQNKSIPVECGRCPKCIAKRTSQWSFRLRKEGDRSSSSLFVTLTYDSENIPLTNRGFPTLNPDDVTLFFKRLRKRSKEKIKYYYVGEYGTQNQRPHYHIILFNAKHEDIEKSWINPETGKSMGIIHYGTVTGASIGYTLKYIIKEPVKPNHPGNNRLPEFARMSKGLGSNYLTADIMYWHTDRRKLLQRLCCEIDGKKVPIPRYYKTRIYDNQHMYLIQQEAEKLHKKNLEIIERTINLHNQIEAHKLQFELLIKSKHKNKHL